ncbi:hypothetical protein LR48_Vigan01g115300 [Vigna angularis]|uniref:Uncharacterized protein n=1 Tax=Phaseolus angularis TaxID=3914 RepID=A0A0L9TLX5_PHAAN|nr:hypothetical protein LR48_Vigan01g115300 [Vigna angularis]
MSTGPTRTVTRVLIPLECFIQTRTQVSFSLSEKYQRRPPPPFNIHAPATVQTATAGGALIRSNTPPATPPRSPLVTASDPPILASRRRCHQRRWPSRVAAQHAKLSHLSFFFLSQTYYTPTQTLLPSTMATLSDSLAFVGIPSAASFPFVARHYHTADYHFQPANHETPSHSLLSSRAYLEWGYYAIASIVPFILAERAIPVEETSNFSESI